MGLHVTCKIKSKLNCFDTDEDLQTGINHCLMSLAVDFYKETVSKIYVSRFDKCLNLNDDYIEM